MIYLALAYYYLGPLRSIALLSYLLSVVGWRNLRSVSVLEFFVVGYLLVRTAIGVHETSLLVGFLYLRLYWGFLFFYFYFKANRTSLDSLFVILCLVTIAEYLAVNLNPGLIGFLPNYQQTELLLDHLQTVGLLGGVHSFGGNRTVSGVLLLAIFIHFDRAHSRLKWVALVGTVLCFSGLALVMTLGYLVMRNATVRHSPYMLAVAVGGFAIVGQGEELFYRASFAYFRDVILDYKLDQIDRAVQMLFAAPEVPFIGAHGGETESLEVPGYSLTFGDFLFLEFLVNYGVIGSVLFAAVFISNLNRTNAWPLLVIVAGTFHYHVIFSLPGQVIVAWFLNRGGKHSEQVRALRTGRSWLGALRYQSARPKPSKSNGHGEMLDA